LEGFEGLVVTDARSSRAERNRAAAFNHLAGNGVEQIATL